MVLQARIDELWEEGRVEEGPIVETIDLLDRGELRVAEPGPDGWVVNEWAKKAILLYFRLRKVETMDVGGLRYLDKIPVKRVDPALGVRVVPPGVARYGAFLGEGVVLGPDPAGVRGGAPPRGREVPTDARGADGHPGERRIHRADADGVVRGAHGRSLAPSVERADGRGRAGAGSGGCGREPRGLGREASPPGGNGSLPKPKVPSSGRKVRRPTKA